MEMDIISFISQFGFPIAMCLYFIFIMEKTIKKNTEAIQELKIAIIQNTAQEEKKK